MALKKSFPIFILMIALVAAGCAAKKVRVGSDTWHQTRIAEIQAAYDKGEISQDQYLQLKNQADQIRAEYDSASSYRHSHMGYRYGRGSSIGVGVGF